MIERKDLKLALKNMINWTYQQQAFARKLKGALSRGEWAKEYCTVKYSLPRQSGHTTMIRELCKEEFFERPALFVPLETMLGNYNRSIVGGRLHVASATELVDDGVKEVIIDSSSFVSKETIETMYKFFNAKLFLLIQ